MATLAVSIRPVPPLDSPTDIALIWQEAIRRYEQITDQKISTLDPVTSVDGLLRQTRKTASRFRLHRHDNSKLDKLRTLIGKSLGTVEAVGNIVGSAASLAFAPSTVILSAVSYLLKTAKSVSSDYDTLNDFFKDLDQYLSQLKILEGSIPPMPELHAALARVLTSVLVLCGVSVKYTRQNRFLKGFKNLVKGEDSELRAAYADFHRSVENENIAVRNATLVELQQNLAISTRTEQKTETIVTQTERINQYFEDQEDKDARNAVTSERQDILRSLSSVKFHDKHHDVLAKRHPNTGQWLLDSEEFQQWFQGDKCTTLWCPGTAGTGKTVLTSVAVDYIQQMAFSGDIAVVYVYCDYKDAMTKSDGELVASLTQQLAEQIDTVPPELKRFHEKKQQRTRAVTNEDRLSVMKSLVTHFSRVYVFIDALDECSKDNRDKFLWYMKRMQGFMHIFITSRPHVDLDSCFIHMSRLEIVARDSDIKEYLLSEVDRDTTLAKLIARDPQLKGEIIHSISTKAKGMFLLACLQMAGLAKQSPRSIRKSLEAFPTGIYATYQEAIARIQEQSPVDAEFGMKALSYVFFATKPLRVNELLHALAVEPGDTDIDRTAISEAEIIINLCAGLIMIDEESNSARLIHYTLQEYLESVQLDLFPHGEVDFSSICLTYLSFDVFDAGPCDTEDSILERLEKYPFFEYISLYWGIHVKKCGQPPELIDQILQYMSSPKKMLSAVQLDYTIELHSEDWYTKYPKHFSPLHVAAYWDLDKVLTILIKEVIDINLVTDAEYGYTPLFLAAGKGHESAVKFLIENGADLEFQDSQYGQTPLSRAVGGGHSAVVQQLIDHGADIHTRDSVYNSTPLILAAFNGFETIVGLLLDKGADIEARDTQSYFTPLLFAAEHGHEQVVQRLLDKHANVNAADSKNNRSPLNKAAVNGHEGIVKLLLEYGADIDAIDSEYGRTALCEAALEGFPSVVELLIKHGADIEAHSDGGSSPLLLASINGRADVVKLLLEHHANIESEDSSNWRPLLAAASNGHEEVVQLLLEHGANREHTNSMAFTPLSFAAQDNYLSVMRQLLQRNVNINHQTNAGNTPLSIASAAGHEKVVAMLLDSGADTEPPNNDGWTALMRAARNGHQGVVHLLLNRGASTDLKTIHGWTAFLLAVRGGHDTIVSSLIKHRPEVLSQIHPNGETALAIAAELGYEAVVKVLLNTPIDINRPDKHNRTALHWACVGGHTQVVQHLINRNAALELQDTSGGTPLTLAITFNYEAIIYLLLRTQKINLSSTDIFGRSPVFLASVHGHEHLAILFTSYGCEITSHDIYLSTLLHVAVKQGHENLLRTLLNSHPHTTDLDSTDYVGRTPLWWSRRCDYPAIEELLLDHAYSLGIRLRDPGPVPKKVNDPGTGVKSGAWCDICTLPIYPDKGFYTCVGDCCEERLAICDDCYGLGACRCNRFHELVVRVAQKPTS